MHMVRTRPFSLARDFDALFSPPAQGPRAQGPRTQGPQTWSPRVDIYEVDATLNLCFELAGFKAEDLEITLDDGLLKVSGSRSFDTPEGAKTYRSELARGTFSRTLRVTDAYDADKVNASYANGLLEILLEKRPEVLPRTIEIATS